MSFYDCRKCGHTVHEDDFDHGRSDQCLDCLRAENEKRIAELRARVEAMAEPELAAFWRKLDKIGDSPEDMAFAAGYAEGLAKQAAELEEARAGHEKYYVKARVYGAIAAEWRKALGLFAGRGEAIAVAALAWRNSEQGGVPKSAVDEIGALLGAETALEAARAKAEQFERDWCDAKTEFAAALAVAHAELDMVRAEKLRENAGAEPGEAVCFRGAEARAEALVQGFAPWCNVTQWRRYPDGITVAKVDGAWVVAFGPHDEPMRWRNATLHGRTATISAAKGDTATQPSQLDELVDYSFERLEDPDKEGGKP